MAVYPPAGQGNAGRFTPLPDGGTPILECGGLPPCRTGELRAVYPLPDGGTPNAMWRFTPLPDGGTPGGLPPAGRGNADLECGGLPPCRTGARRFGMWRFTPPLPDGGTPIWIVAVYAGYGNVTATIANVLPK